MKTIGIDAHMLGDHSGGNESYYSNILKEMMTLDHSDLRLILFVKEGVDVSPFEDCFEIVRFKSNNSFIRNFVELTLLSFKYKLDVLHTQYFIPFIRSCPVVCTIHDICFEHYKDIFIRSEYIRQKILIPYSARKSEFIFSVSKHAGDDIIDNYKIDPGKVVITYNAVNKDFHIMKDSELDIEGLKAGFGITRPYILSVGNLQPRKNLNRLIKAYEAYNLRSEGSHQLVIVGKKAWLYDDILKNAVGNTDGIILTDYVSQEDLVRLYNGAECFIYPSYFEGFGIPPLEAMACGTYVAVGNLTSLPEVVGDAGLYFDPFDIKDIEDKLEKLLKLSSEEKTLLDDKMRGRVEFFSWRKSAEVILDTYRKC